MNKFLKLFYALMAKGYATDAEKAKLKQYAKSEDAPADAEEKVEEAEALPAEAPAEGEEEVDEDEEEVDEVADEEAKSHLKKLLSATAKSMRAEMKAEMTAWKKEQSELMEKRAGLFNKEVQKDRSGLNKRVKTFVTALIDRDVAILKDMSGATGAAGGYLIDTELAAEVAHLQTEYGVARREFFTTPLTKGSILINNLATDVSVYWTTETSAKTSSEVAIGQVELVLKKIAVIVPMSDELLEDDEIDLVGFLTSRIAEGMAKKEDEAFFKGDGTSTYGSFTGILLNSSVNEVEMAAATFSSIDADDLIDMVDATPQGAHANGKFYMHRTIMSFVRKLKDSDNRYIYQAPSDGGPATIWGYPVVLVEAMPAKADSAAETAFVAFGDLKKACWLGYKQGLRVAISDQATVRNTAANADIDLFRQDMTALRVVERVGFVVVVATAITVLKTAAESA
ncbi:MAG: phage major capsid protein [Candidatus Omnitrophota bacterium]|nr:phage major capsid protein [Candidatus Omnitrophota bacterium]